MGGNNPKDNLPDSNNLIHPYGQYMIPLKDDNKSNILPLVTIGLIVSCAAVFLWQQSLDSPTDRRAVFALGFIPAVILDGRPLAPGLDWVPFPATLVTYQFLHGGWWHIITNLLYLWIFGDNVEDAMGHGRFLLFYLICGIAAAVFQGVIDPNSRIPMIGASGAVAGVLGAYVMLYPRANVLVFIPLIVFFWIARIPALVVLGIWFLWQFVNATGSDLSKGGVAFWAHVGGFLIGMALVHLFKRRQPPAVPPTGSPPADANRPPSRRHRIPDSGN